MCTVWRLVAGLLGWHVALHSRSCACVCLPPLGLVQLASDWVACASHTPKRAAQWYERKNLRERVRVAEASGAQKAAAPRQTAKGGVSPYPPRALAGCKLNLAKCGQKPKNSTNDDVLFSFGAPLLIKGNLQRQNQAANGEPLSDMATAAASPGGAATARQFVYFDDELDKFCIDEATCSTLESIDEQIGTQKLELIASIHFFPHIAGCVAAVVIVTGAYRTGKSFLMNQLAGDGGFSVGHSVQSHTRGIWVGSQPIQGQTAAGEPMKVLLMDSEGMGSTDKDQKYDTTVFSLAALLCSALVFNGKGTISEESIAQLGFIANMTQHIRIGSSDSDSADGAGGTAASTQPALDSTSDLERFFPSFLWVLRDFALRLEDEDGDEITPDEYMNNALQPQPGFSADIAARNRVRTSISGFFKNRHCVPLVKPVENDELLQDLQTVPPAELRTPFLQGISDLKQRLFHNARPKTLGGSDRPVTGPILVQLARHYVAAINSGGVPSITDAWSAATQSRTHAAVQAAKDAFLRGVTPGEGVKAPPLDTDTAAAGGAAGAWQLPLDEPQLLQVLAAAKRSAMHALQTGAPTGAPSAQIQAAQHELEAFMGVKGGDLQRANETAAKAGCKAGIQEALRAHLDPAQAAVVHAANKAAQEAKGGQGGQGGASTSLQSSQTHVDNVLSAFHTAVGVFLEHASGPTAIKLDALASLGLPRALQAASSALREVDACNSAVLQQGKDQALAKEWQCSALQAQLEALETEHRSEQQRAAALAAENSDAKARLDARAQELSASRNTNREMQEQLDRHTHAAEQTGAELTRLSAQLATTRDELQSERRSLVGMQSQHRDAKQQMASLAASVRDATRAAADSDTALQTAASANSEQKRELEQLTAQLKETQQKLSGATAAAEAAAQQAKEASDRAATNQAAAAAAAVATATALQEQLAKAQGETTAADRRWERLKAQLEQSKAAALALQEQLEAEQRGGRSATEALAASTGERDLLRAELEKTKEQAAAAQKIATEQQRRADDLAQRLQRVTDLACSSADEADAEAARCRSALRSAADALQAERAEHARSKAQLGTAEVELDRVQTQLKALRGQLQRSEEEQVAAADTVTRVSQAVHHAAGHSSALQRTCAAQAAALLRLRRLESRRADLQVALSILRGGMRLVKYSSKGKPAVRWVRLTASGGGIGWHDGDGRNTNAAERTLSTVVPLASVTGIAFGAWGGGVRAARAAGTPPSNPLDCFTISTIQRAYCFAVPAETRVLLQGDVWRGSSAGDPTLWQTHDVVVTLVHGLRCLLLREGGRNALAVPRVQARLELLRRRLPALTRQRGWRQWHAQVVATGGSAVGAGQPQ